VSKIKDWALDLTGATGMCLVAFGAWQVYPPAGYIVGGLLLLGVSYLLSKEEPKQ
jgi:hypothetical protein